jgi:hypothetical protein
LAIFRSLSFPLLLAALFSQWQMGAWRKWLPDAHFPLHEETSSQTTLVQCKNKEKLAQKTSKFLSITFLVFFPLNMY